MKGDAARVIENVAASVADGARVDWDRAGAQVSGRELRLVSHLRLIHSVAEVYRSLPPLAEDDGSGASARPDYPEGPRWGRLILLDRIGRGSSADVFKAWDAELQREVALKLLHDAGSSQTANARMLQEARRLARIRHPHVAHVYGAENHEGRIGLWMELVRGRSLDTIVREDGPLPVVEAAHIAIDVCSALAAVHGAGLLHRDVKAQNVLREDDGRTVLMDFGTGEEITAGKPGLAGTPIYLAPEIIAQKPASVQSDVYSAGVLLFYLLTGEFPVTADSLEGLGQAHREGCIRRIADLREDLPSGFARVVDRALSPQPSRRYASASAMESALRQALADAMAPPRRHTQWWLMAATGITIAGLVGALVSGRGAHPPADGNSNITSLAVLPLKFVSGEAEAPYLADALTDQLITTLGQVHSVKVTAQTSVARFKGSDTPVADIAKQLGVDGVVEGTVAVQHQPTGEPARARVNVRLIRAGSDLELWSGSLERPIGDMLALEAELARTITRQIHGALDPQSARQLQSPRTTNPAAEQAYLQGRYHLMQGSSQAKLALESFQRALQFDPNHASAHAGAARSFVSLGFDNLLTYPASRASAVEHTMRAIELDPDLAEAHAVAADLKFYFDWDWTGADREYARAVNLEPSSTYARSQYARFLSAAKRVDEAVSQAAEAVRLDPLSSEAAVTSGLMLHYARRDAEADNALQRALQIDPTSSGAHYVLGRVREAQGRMADAISETDQAIQSTDHFSTAWAVQAICLQARSGQIPEARAAFGRLVARLGKENMRLDPAYDAEIRLALQDLDQAFASVDRAISERDPGVLWFAVDPRLDPYRTHPRFERAIERLGIP